jgi:hypothetical protein
MTAALALPAECLRAAMNCGADQLAAVLWSAVKWNCAVAVTEGSWIENVNKTGVRLWTACSIDQESESNGIDASRTLRRRRDAPLVALHHPETHAGHDFRSNGVFA